MIPCDISSTVSPVTLFLKEVIMKRAAIFGMFAAVVATAWTFLAAQSGPSNKLNGNSRLPEPAPALAPAPAVPVVVGHPAPSEPLTPLQQRFVELSAKKAHLMTEEQLQQALNNLDQEVQELTAWSKIEETARLLREVVEKHPQTKAAEAAKSALNAIDQNRPAITPLAEPRSQEPRIDPPSKGRRYERESTPFGRSSTKRKREPTS
jgi:TolA-binding protein